MKRIPITPFLILAALFTVLGVDLMESVIEQYCEVNISDYYKGKNAYFMRCAGKLIYFEFTLPHHISFPTIFRTF